MSGQVGDSFRRIVFATDGSKGAARAFEVAAELCGRYGAELIILHSIPAPYNLLAAASRTASSSVLDRYYADARESGKKMLDEVVASARARGIPTREAVLDRPSSPVEAITAFAASETADLIVMGSRGLSGFRKLLLGSVSSGVLSHATCSVLIVR